MPRSEPVLIPPFKRPPSRVAIRRSQSYDSALSSLLFETLQIFGLPVRGKNVFLKPNFVGPDSQRIINTHPAIVAAAREAFLRLGASRVIIGDGPAVERDFQGILESMRLMDYGRDLMDDLVDLNTDDVRKLVLKTHASKLSELYLPNSLQQADFVVSMPKLKTHHWAGASLSLKNMFGVVPGSCYGWPKNVLHWAGIDKAILDLNAALRPDFAIIDGIVGMEGNGPIQGQPKACGALILGDDPVAVDATAARVMELRPEKIKHVEAAGTLLGHVDADKIQQLGETIESTRTDFAVLDQFKELKMNGNRG
jgi:uncharacterized protein (DUF362 family)